MVAEVRLASTSSSRPKTPKTGPPAAIIHFAGSCWPTSNAVSAPRIAATLSSTPHPRKEPQTAVRSVFASRLHWPKYATQEKPSPTFHSIAETRLRV